MFEGQQAVPNQGLRACWPLGLAFIQPGAIGIVLVMIRDCPLPTAGFAEWPG